MKTYPIMRDDGTLQGFEITSTWVTLAPLFRTLRAVNGVTDIRRTRSDDVRISFNLHGKRMQVCEPWGDNSRYLVIPEDEFHELDMADLHEAFRKYTSPVARLWSVMTRLFRA